MTVLDHLKRMKYDYLPLPVGDGIHDDTYTIQARIYSGLPVFIKGGYYNISKFLICEGTLIGVKQ